MFLPHLYRFIAFLGLILVTSQVMGQCVSGQKGAWNAPATWSCQGSVDPRVPICSDVSIIIATADTVELTALQDYSGCNPMHIIVEGVLNFPANGPKLKLPIGSTISGSGNITSTAPNNNNNQSQANFIEIGNQVVWKKGDGPVIGPFSFPANPLPVELLSFEGHAGVDVVHLSWTVASEINNDFFTIERSPDMVTWSAVHAQSGHGTSNQIRTYRGHDARPERRLMYYRLTQTDFDGSRDSFDPISINYGVVYTYGQRPLLFPNPLDLSAQQDLFVTNLNDDIVQITILDLNGNAIQKIDQSEISTNPGRIEIDHEAFSAGIYLVRIEGISRVESEKLIVY